MEKLNVQRIPTYMAVIKAKDDVFAVTRDRHGFRETIFFGRYRNGDIAVIWEDPRVEVVSLGSPKERRARWARAEAAANAEARRRRKAALTISRSKP